MDDTIRSCRRPGCGWAATASLSFRYATGQVWLRDLSPTPDPSLYDLCASHADALTVPRGWEQVDERTPGADEVAARRPRVAGPADVAPLREPVSAGRVGPAQDRRNRYEGLSRELPQLAARLAAEVADDEHPSQPVASRELAPLSFGATLPRRRSA